MQTNNSKIDSFECLGFGPSIKQKLCNTSSHREERTQCKDVCVGNHHAILVAGCWWHSPCARVARKVEEEQLHPSKSASDMKNNCNSSLTYSFSTLLFIQKQSIYFFD